MRTQILGIFDQSTIGQNKFEWFNRGSFIS